MTAFAVAVVVVMGWWVQVDAGPGGSSRMRLKVASSIGARKQPSQR